MLGIEMIANPQEPQWHLTSKQRSRVRSLRRASTDAEKTMWNALRAHRLEGAGFKRQVPIGPYVADFACHAAKLIVEIDGGQHFTAEHLGRDARRDAYLTQRGFRVLRFNNHEVLSNRQGVLETISTALAAAPSLALPRKRGRGLHLVRGDIA
jgi:very-short-patch-repair endonuclease